MCIRDSLTAMQQGQVSVLLVHDSDPVHSLPGFAQALDQVGTVVSFASMLNATAARADFILPDHSNMESWGDAAPRPGIRTLVQPTLRPLLDTQATGDTLLDLGRGLGGSMPEGSFVQVLQAAWSDTDWDAALGRGGVFSDGVEAPVTVGAGISEIQFEPVQLAGTGDPVSYTHLTLPTICSV